MGGFICIKWSAISFSTTFSCHNLSNFTFWCHDRPSDKVWNVLWKCWTSTCPQCRGYGRRSCGGGNEVSCLSKHSLIWEKGQRCAPLRRRWVWTYSSWTGSAACSFMSAHELLPNACVPSVCVWARKKRGFICLRGGVRESNPSH